ncbi:uncharacterized protein LOC110444668 [Mizuhopecten yessoensis]|uniref:uncharacterized protein LOC110444668 n=1 Tax=Mizuhopecten yessoensis TaxID=6573 RepID=UPI000B45EDB7|nr:uncharacterized protein LOC110444668 [Mizuhopecten yessoensis]
MTRDQIRLLVLLQDLAPPPQDLAPPPALVRPQGTEGREAIGLGPDLSLQNQRSSKNGQGRQETGRQDPGGRGHVLPRTVDVTPVDPGPPLIQLAAPGTDQGGRGTEPAEMTTSTNSIP